MTPARWREVEAVFWAALDHEPDQGAAFLDQACAADVALRREVESLPAAHEGTAALLEAPAVPPATLVGGDLGAGADLAERLNTARARRRRYEPRLRGRRDRPRPALS